MLLQSVAWIALTISIQAGALLSDAPPKIATQSGEHIAWSSTPDEEQVNVIDPEEYLNAPVAHAWSPTRQNMPVEARFCEEQAYLPLTSPLKWQRQRFNNCLVNLSCEFRVIPGLYNGASQESGIACYNNDWVRTAIKAGIPEYTKQRLAKCLRRSTPETKTYKLRITHVYDANRDNITLGVEDKDIEFTSDEAVVGEGGVYDSCLDGLTVDEWFDTSAKYDDLLQTIVNLRQSLAGYTLQYELCKEDVDGYKQAREDDNKACKARYEALERQYEQATMSSNQTTHTPTSVKKNSAAPALSCAVNTGFASHDVTVFQPIYKNNCGTCGKFRFRFQNSQGHVWDSLPYALGPGGTATLSVNAFGVQISSRPISVTACD